MRLLPLLIPVSSLWAPPRRPASKLRASRLPELDAPDDAFAPSALAEGEAARAERQARLGTPGDSGMMEVLFLGTASCVPSAGCGAERSCSVEVAQRCVSASARVEAGPKGVASPEHGPIRPRRGRYSCKRSC